MNLSCHFLMLPQRCGGELYTRHGADAMQPFAFGTPCICCTFAFISSRPTVATVLVGGLFFFSSFFCGRSRRCSRRLIPWFHPEPGSREGEKEQR